MEKELKLQQDMEPKHTSKLSESYLKTKEDQAASTVEGCFHTCTAALKYSTHVLQAFHVKTQLSGALEVAEFTQSAHKQ